MEINQQSLFQQTNAFLEYAFDSALTFIRFECFCSRYKWEKTDSKEPVHSLALQKLRGKASVVYVSPAIFTGPILCTGLFGVKFLRFITTTDTLDPAKSKS